MKNEQSQIQQPSRLFEMKILRLATLLSEGDEGLDRDGFRRVEDLRSQGETVPLSLEQAIARTSP